MSFLSTPPTYERKVPTKGYTGHMPKTQNNCGMSIRQTFRASTAGQPIPENVECLITSQRERVCNDALEFVRKQKAMENVRFLSGEETRMHSSWADVRTDLSKPHGSWRRGIVGYQGHFPLWVKDKHSFELKQELGKPYPPYIPRLNDFNCIVPPK